MGKSKKCKRSGEGGERRLSIIQRQLVAALRLVWSRYDPAKKKIKEESKVYVPKTNKDGKQSKKFEVWYQCGYCKELYRNRSDVHVHHLKPVSHTPSWPIDPMEWGEYLKRLFCERSDLVVLCVGCHYKMHERGESIEN